MGIIIVLARLVSKTHPFMSSKDSLNSYNKFLDCGVDETTRLTIRTVDMVTILMEN